MRAALHTASIVKVAGHLLLIEALMLLLPLAVSLAYGEHEWVYFLLASASAGVCGGALTAATRRVYTVVKAREAFVLTALIWVLFGIFGTIPFMTGSAPLGFTDAMFETISGFTTTGASVIADVEKLPRGLLFWRALTQWVGGLGIILFMLALLPELNRSVGISMFHAETSGITHDRLHPRIRQTALSLWGIYIVLTAVSAILLWAGPMNLFDAVCQTFAAIATGGFSTYNDGISHWHSNYVLVVLTFVMFVAGLNFMLLYQALRGGPKMLWRSDTARAFGAVTATAVLLLGASNILRGGSGVEQWLFHPLFHAVSAITSTGFSITGAEDWGSFALLVTLLLMLCGSCAGSTSGGIKMDRILVMWRNLKNELRRTVYPRRIYVVRLEGSYLQGALVSRVSAFVALYILIALGATAVITFFGYSFTDSLFMTASCIGCNGLGYGATGSGGSFAALPDAVKWLMTVLMLIGRLELFTFMALLLPAFWRK